MITEEQLKELLNKKVLYMNADKSIQIAGKLTFYGFNHLLPNWKYQLTIDRMPITNVDLENDTLTEVIPNMILTKALM